MRWLRRSHLFAFFLELWSLFFPTSQAFSTPTCNDIYGSPTQADCTAALASLPRDTAVHYFVEQQIRTAPPVANWIPFVDHGERDPQLIVQLPKWWSRGESDFFHQ